MKPRAKAKPTARSGKPRRGPLRPPASKQARKPHAEVPQKEFSSEPVARAAAVPEGDVRGEKLHKVLAQAGFGSRRAMEERIRSGEVMVNGKVATIGDRVTPEDRVKVGDKIPVKVPDP